MKISWTLTIDDRPVWGDSLLIDGPSPPDPLKLHAAQLVSLQVKETLERELCGLHKDAKHLPK